MKVAFCIKFSLHPNTNPPKVWRGDTILLSIATTNKTKQFKTIFVVWYYYRLKKPTPPHHTTPGLITF